MQVGRWRAGCYIQRDGWVRGPAVICNPLGNEFETEAHTVIYLHRLNTYTRAFVIICCGYCYELLSMKI